MSLDPNDPISRLQSPAVIAALSAIAINTLTLIATFTGITFNIEIIKIFLDNGLSGAVNVLSLYLAYRSYKGRVTATKQIVPLPWLEEIKSMKEKP